MVRGGKSDQGELVGVGGDKVCEWSGPLPRTFVAIAGWEERCFAGLCENK